MPVETVNLFLALLFFGAMVVLVGAVVAGLIRLVTGSLPAPVARLVAEVRPLALVFAWLSATVATLGSLYYSEVADYTPCPLCWYQRYAMYPSAAILTVSLLLKRPRLAWGAFALSAVGIMISAFHRFQEQFPDAVKGVCDPFNPCYIRDVNTFGFVTIPTKAFAAFGLVLLFVPLALLHPKEAAS